MLEDHVRLRDPCAPRTLRSWAFTSVWLNSCSQRFPILQSCDCDCCRWLYVFTAWSPRSTGRTLGHTCAWRGQQLLTSDDRYSSSCSSSRRTMSEYVKDNERIRQERCFLRTFLRNHLSCVKTSGLPCADSDWFMGIAMSWMMISYH